METITVRCEAGLSHSPYFTHGKLYQATECFDGSRVFNVRDDKGNARVIMLDLPSPHFYPMDSLPSESGRFVRV